MKSLLLDNAYAYCEAVCRESSTTFYSSFSALQWDKRRAVHAVYALCRWVDDIVDGDEEPTVLETKELRQATDDRQRLVDEIHAGKTPVLPEPEHRRRMMALVIFDSSSPLPTTKTSGPQTTQYSSPCKMFSRGIQLN